MTDRVLEYLSNDKRDIHILDVGCSIAVAARLLKERLEYNGIKLHMTGIDPSGKVREDAEKNLDVFINQDVMDVDASLYPLDIVIFCNVVSYLSHEKKAAMIRRCALFLRDTGSVLITNTPTFETTSSLSDAKSFFQDYLELRSSTFKGPKKFYAHCKEIGHERVKRKMHSFRGKEEAEKYADKIIESWNQLGVKQKFLWKVEMGRAHFAAKIRRFEPRRTTRRRIF